MRLTNKAARQLIRGWYASEPGWKEVADDLTDCHFPPTEGDSFDLDLDGVRLEVRDGKWHITETERCST